VIVCVSIDGYSRHGLGYLGSFSQKRGSAWERCQFRRPHIRVVSTANLNANTEPEPKPDSICRPPRLPRLLSGSLLPRRAADRVVDHVVIVVRVVIADGNQGRGCGQVRLHDRFVNRDGVACNACAASG
jgi:hypothetical protein